MIKRHFFVVLAGIITAGAVLGWSQKPVTGSAPQPVSKPSPQIIEKTAGNSYHETVLPLLNATDKVVGAELQVLALDESVRGGSQDAPGLRLVSPGVGPLLIDAPAAQKPASALGVLRGDETLKTAKTVAVVDLAAQKIIEADGDVVFDPVTKDAAGTRYLARDGRLSLVAWNCLDESRSRCLYALSEAAFALDAEVRCDAANQSFIQCGNGPVDTFALFDAAQCTPAQARQAIEAALAGKGDSGVIDVGGAQYQFVKTTLDSGCTLTSVNAAPATAVVDVQAGTDIPAPAVNDKAPRFTIRAWGAAIGAGILMILLGYACTRRKDPEIVTETPKKALKDSDDKDKNNEENAKLKASLEKEQQDKAKILKKLEQFESESKDNAFKVEQLGKELEAARSAFKKEEIARLSLEEEKRRLEDSLASRPASNTVVDSPVHFAQTGSHSNIPLDAKPKAEESGTKSTNRVTTPVDEHQLAALRSGDISKDFFDALSDDGWDEIAESFDAILAPKKDDPNANSLSSKFGLGQDVLNLLNDLSLPESIAKDDSSAENEKVPSKEEKAVAAPDREPLGDGLHGNTMKLLSLSKPLPKPDVDTVKPISSAQSRTTKSSPANVKPLPSYTMKGVALGNQASAPVADSPAPKMQKSVDDNSLYEALKRRAKDVSQMDMPNAGNNNKPKQSGAFDFNRGLSKSGVFSLTGSRVDIDPLSETEYFKALYDKYIQTQKECGEVTDKFTLEQFVSRLAREKDRLMKTYKCKNVRFSVYVKDGKASLKATPQK